MYTQLNHEVVRHTYAELLRERPEPQLVKDVAEDPRRTRITRMRKRLSLLRPALRPL
jgi:hypothetical protein